MKKTAVPFLDETDHAWMVVIQTNLATALNQSPFKLGIQLCN